MNVIPRLDFELAYDNVAVQYVNHDTTDQQKCQTRSVQSIKELSVLLDSDEMFSAELTKYGAKIALKSRRVNLLSIFTQHNLLDPTPATNSKQHVGYCNNHVDIVKLVLFASLSIFTSHPPTDAAMGGRTNQFTVFESSMLFYKTTNMPSQ